MKDIIIGRLVMNMTLKTMLSTGKCLSVVYLTLTSVITENLFLTSHSVFYTW